MQEKKWNFTPSQDGVVTTATTAVGCVVLGVGLSFFFTPVALAAAAGYGLYNVTRGAMMQIPKVRENYFNEQVKKGHYKLVDDDHPTVKMAAEISNALGRKEPPKMYTVDDATVAKMALPFGLRWMMKIPDIRKQAMPNVFAALPGMNTLIATQEALDRKRPAEEMKFIMAHEMSHIHANDNRSPAIFGRTMVKKVGAALFWGTAAAIGLGMFGVAVPVVAGGSALLALGGLWGVTTAAKFCFNLAMRTVENRADRNAMYITRDYESGCDALASIDPTSQKPSGPNIFKEYMMDHPSWHPRVKTMKDSFNKASEYPEIMPVTLPAPKPVAANDKSKLSWTNAATFD